VYAVFILLLKLGSFTKIKLFQTGWLREVRGYMALQPRGTDSHQKGIDPFFQWTLSN